MTPEQIEIERKEFEAWFSDEGKFPRSVEKRVDGAYVLMTAHSAWSVWLARAEKAQRVRDALESCLAMLEVADCSTGCCCCGSAVEGHGIGDGHGPVDDGDYHQSKAIEAARTALKD